MTGNSIVCTIQFSHHHIKKRFDFVSSHLELFFTNHATNNTKQISYVKDKKANLSSVMCGHNAANIYFHVRCLRSHNKVTFNVKEHEIEKCKSNLEIF